MATPLDRIKAINKQANAWAQAMAIAVQLVPLVKITPKATKHLST
jgi:hypothetical protein